MYLVYCYIYGQPAPSANHISGKLLAEEDSVDAAVSISAHQVYADKYEYTPVYLRQTQSMYHWGQVLGRTDVDDKE